MKEESLALHAQKRVKPRPVLLVHIGQLLTLRSPAKHNGVRRGPALNQLAIIKDAAVFCLGGKIVCVGKTDEALRDSAIRKYRNSLLEVDCCGKVALPGFVDSHTHPAFISPRLVDFDKRIAGATYQEIASSGGGIRSSLAGVRSATSDELAGYVFSRLQEILAHGTTTAEAKSGYGLSLGSELKSLFAIRRAADSWPGTLVSTLLGAHVVPAEFKQHPEDYVRQVCEQMIPRAAQRKLAQFVDVFCDPGAFSESQCARIFAAARKHGFHVKAHVSQLARTPLSKLLTFQPVSLDHLDFVSHADIARLAKSNTVATLVPGANFFLGLSHYPPARKLIESGVAIALATDFNPGSSPVASMPFVLSLACTQMKMSAAEAIAAATINGAYALNLAGSKGSIEPGKDADIAVFDVNDYREIPYWISANKCERVLANGMSIVEATGSGSPGVPSNRNPA
jgi:imidazolonepropionase